MHFYAYILQSEKDSSFYKGSTSHPCKRLQQHNNGEGRYTKTKLPWNLVYVEELPSKRDMLIRERNLKRGHKEYFLKLINSDKNIVHLFI